MNRLIVITGASGHIGGRVAALLSERGHRLRLVVRDLSRAPKLPGCQVVRAEYGDPATLNAAFTDADVAFIVPGHSAPGHPEPGARALLHKNAFEAAACAQVSRIVYISQQNASPQTRFLGGQDHFLSEEYLKATGVPFTILRDNFYIDEIPARFGPHGVFRGALGQGSVAWVSREDIAQVAAAILGSPQSFNGLYDVTGPEALTLPETARRLSVLVGRDLRYEEEPADELRAQLAAQCVEPFQIEAYLGFCLAIRANEFAPVSDTVARFTGRAPFSVEAYFAAYPHLLDKIRASAG